MWYKSALLNPHLDITHEKSNLRFYEIKNNM